MSIKQILITLTATLIFIGCSSHSGHFSPFVSSEINLSKNRADIIINDFITIVKAYYSPARTVFQIEKTNSIFAKNIEAKLRKKGYGLGAIYGKNIKRVPLAWKITPINKKMIRVSYHISDVSISRIYQLKQNQYQPFSSFSAVGLDSRKFSNLDFTMPSYQELSVISFAKVTANSLKIRSKPTTKSNTIGIIKKGETISYSEIVIDKQNQEWVKLEGGGYMKASYLKF